MKWVWLILLAGCVGPATVEVPEHVTEFEVGPLNCSGAFALRAPEFSAMDAWLPPGFEAEDASEVIERFGVDTVAADRGLMGAFVSNCPEQNDLELLAFWILVKEPTISGVAPSGSLHWYEHALFGDDADYLPTLSNWGIKAIAMESQFADLPSTEYLQGREFSGDVQETNILEFSVKAGIPTNFFESPMSIWQVALTETVEFRTTFQTNITLGAGKCSSATEWVVEFLEGCGQTSPLLAFGAISNMNYEGQYIRHPAIPR